LCLVEGDGAERLAGFEVNSTSDHEKGLIQANRYREGVHEASVAGGTMQLRQMARSRRK
jgi:hypothetical protein